MTTHAALRCWHAKYLCLTRQAEKAGEDAEIEIFQRRRDALAGLLGERSHRKKPGARFGRHR